MLVSVSICICALLTFKEKHNEKIQMTKYVSMDSSNLKFFFNTKDSDNGENCLHYVGRALKLRFLKEDFVPILEYLLDRVDNFQEKFKKEVLNTKNRMGITPSQYITEADNKKQNRLEQRVDLKIRLDPSSNLGSLNRSNSMSSVTSIF